MTSGNYIQALSQLWQKIDSYSYAGNSVQDYLQALAIVAFLTTVFWLIKRFVLWRLREWAKKTAIDFDDLLVELVAKVRFLFLVLIAIPLALQTLSLPQLVNNISQGVLVTAVTVQMLLLLQEIIDYLINKRLAAQDQQEEVDFHASESILRNFGSIIKYSLWVLGLLLILSNLGFNVTSLLAGLGVGGIAVAFALQNILSDLFSSLAIYFDQPFKVGDFIILGDYMGSVEKIGIKSTRVRSISGEEIIVPNRELTNARIKNYKSLERRRVVLSFGVAYETSNQKLEEIPSAVEKIITDLDEVTFNRAHLKALSDSSIDYEVVLHIEDGDYQKFMDVKQQILLELKDYLEKNKITIPYPTRMVYTKPQK